MKIEFPSKSNIDAALKLYDKLSNWKISDKVIRDYIISNKDNKHLENIIIKVILINSLYYAGVYWPLEMARHIEGLAEKQSLDELIAKGELEAVELIADFKIDGNKKNLLSFSSKYCHFHNPDKYSIYDRYVFSVIKKINGLESKKYSTFHEAIINLKEKAGLHQYTLADLDRYLWLYGQKIHKKREEINKEVRNVFVNNEDLLKKL